MILKAKERGPSGQLARHLLSMRDNEHLELHEVYTPAAASDGSPPDPEGEAPKALEQDPALPLIWGEDGFSFFARSINSDPVTEAALDDLRALLADLRRKGNRCDDLYRIPAWWAAVMDEPEYSRDFLLLALFTGMRRNEVASLRWENIDLEERKLTKIDDLVALPDAKHSIRVDDEYDLYVA